MWFHRYIKFHRISSFDMNQGFINSNIFSQIIIFLKIFSEFFQKKINFISLVYPPHIFCNITFRLCIPFFFFVSFWKWNAFDNRKNNSLALFFLIYFYIQYYYSNNLLLWYIYVIPYIFLLQWKLKYLLFRSRL